MHDEMNALPACPVQLHDPARGSLRRGPFAVRAARRARIGASLALMCGFTLLVADTVKLVDLPALVVLTAAWCAAAAVFLVLYAAARLGPPAVPAALLARELGRGSASERNALVLPLVALALVAPLSIHGAISVLLGCGPGHISFDDWVLASLLVVGHAHVTLAVLVCKDAIKLVEDRPGASAKRTLLWTTLTAALPGVLLYAIPPALTAVTGAALIPAMYAWARRTVLAERARLAT